MAWTEEVDRLQTMMSQRVRHDCVTNSFTFHFIQFLIVKRIVSGSQNYASCLLEGFGVGSVSLWRIAFSKHDCNSISSSIRYSRTLPLRHPQNMWEKQALRGTQPQLPTDWTRTTPEFLTTDGAQDLLCIIEITEPSNEENYFLGLRGFFFLLIISGYSILSIIICFHSFIR